MRSVIAATIIAASTMTAVADDPTPFGIGGGAKAHIPAGFKGVYEQYIKPPNPHPEFINYMVSATEPTGICLLRAQTEDYGTNYGRNPLQSGEEIRALFAKIKLQLDSRYGVGDFSESFSLFSYDAEWLKQIVEGEKYYEAKWTVDAQGSKNALTEIRLFVAGNKERLWTQIYVEVEYVFANYSHCRDVKDRENQADEDADAAKL